jgi:hypothetical protein
LTLSLALGRQLVPFSEDVFEGFRCLAGQNEGDARMGRSTDEVELRIGVVETLVGDRSQPEGRGSFLAEEGHGGIDVGDRDQDPRDEAEERGRGEVGLPIFIKA